MSLVVAALLLLAAYLVGAIPFGYLVGRLRGVDLFHEGSGNVGATNAGRVLGWKFGVLVFTFDFLKGAVPVAAVVPAAEFVGPEALIHLGIQAGAVGAVSALAGAFPAEVAAVVRDPTEPGAATLAELRAGVERFPRQAALKRVVASRGVPLRSDVRAPLRDLIEVEAAELDSWLASTTAAAA